MISNRAAKIGLKIMKLQETDIMIKIKTCL